MQLNNGVGIGMASYPLLGEDAQEWVSRTRREGDEHRERLLTGDGFGS
ncbi:hypothetical protein [Nostoc sp. WHI]|nr:hypothetical protein [Nostoc sp. WHI]